MNPNEIPVGIVGLGLMGCSIVTCLLIAGHPVAAVAPIPADLDHAERRIREHLQNAWQNGIIDNEPEYQRLLAEFPLAKDFAREGPGIG